MTGWAVPDDSLELRRQPSREETFSFYGRLELLVRGPVAFATEVADYFWPQVRPAVTDPEAITIEVLVGDITPRRSPRCPADPSRCTAPRMGPFPTGTTHAAAFAVEGGAVALVGGKGSGKTTTVLAAVASGAPLISNDRLYVGPTSSQTTVVGWTDPIRVIGASPEAPKRMIPLIQHAHGDRNQVIEQPLPLAGSGT